MSEPTEADLACLKAVLTRGIRIPLVDGSSDKMVAHIDITDEGLAIVRAHVEAETSVLMRALAETRVENWQLRQENKALKEQLSK